MTLIRKRHSGSQWMIEELRWFRLNRTLEIGHIVEAHRPLLWTLMDRVENRDGKQLEERTTYELPAQNR